MSAFRVYTYNPGEIAGHTVYRNVSQREVKVLVQVGTHRWEEDIGQAYPRVHIEPVFEERTEMHITETWIAVPNAQVAAYEASYGP